MIVYFADEFDEGMIEQRRDLILEVALIGRVDLRGDLRGMPARLAISIARSGRFSGEMRPKAR